MKYPLLAPKSVLTIDGGATRIELRPIRCADCPRMSILDNPKALHLNSGTEIGLNLLRYIAAGECADEAERQAKLAADAYYETGNAEPGDTHSEKRDAARRDAAAWMALKGDG